MALPTLADPQSKSFSHWQVEDSEVSAVLTIPLRDATRLDSSADPSQLPGLWLEHTQQAVQVPDCTLTEARIQPANDGYTRSRLHWQCPTDADQLTIRVDVLFDQVASHVHFAHFSLPGDRHTERLFNQNYRVTSLALSEATTVSNVDNGPVVLTYLRFGFEHILIGLDHIAFLLTLILLPTTWRMLLAIISGFTLGHSVTLSLGTLGIVTPDILYIEALIGLSIALVAIENICCQNQTNRAAAWIIAGVLLVLALAVPIGIPFLAMTGLALFCWCYLQLGESPAAALRIRPAITIAFGLLHGFGFASVLLEVGLPESSRGLALLGFNLGVELGQLLIVALFLAAGVAGRRLAPEWAGRSAGWLSVALCTLGTFWFCQRLLF